MFQMGIENNKMYVYKKDIYVFISFFKTQYYVSFVLYFLNKII